MWCPQNFYVFTIKPWIVLPTFTFSPHTILHLHQMKDDEGAGWWDDGSGSEVNSRIIRSFHFYIQARILSERTQWTRLLHISYTQAFTSLLGIYMESGNWFEMIWTETSSDAGHPGLSPSSFLIIKCKSLAGLRGFQLYGVFYWGFWPSQNGHRWLLPAAVTSPAISRGALPI